MFAKALLCVAVISSQLWGAASFFPLQTGNRWTYREAKTGQTFTVQVNVPTFVNGRVYHSLNGYVSKRLLVRINEVGDLVYLNEDQATEHVLTSFTPFEGGYWNAPFRQCDQEGQTLRNRITYDGPAGLLPNVLQIRYRTFGCADAGIESELFAENIGMLRRVETSFIGPRQFDLVSAQVGNVQINTSVNGRFEIIAEPSSRGDAINVTIRIKTNPATPFKLQFPTSQEYEIVMLDPSGRAVWAWSADKVFAFVLHERSISGEWSASATIPMPNQAQGTYTIQSWMTTLGHMPQFAATVPIVLPSIR